VRLISMAWRNVWRNSRRSMVTIAAMAFALWVMINYMGLVDGMIVGMEHDAVDLEVGDLQVVAQGYRDDPALDLVITDEGALLQGIDALGYQAAPRLLGGGLAAVDHDSAGVRLVGIDVARDARVTSIASRLNSGQWLDPDRPHDVVLGKRLARTLDAHVDDQLLVLSQGADGSIANDLYTIAGIMGGVGDAIDRSTVFMTAGAFRELMVLPQGVHQVTVRVPAGTDLDLAAARVTALDSGQAEHAIDVQTWRQILPTLATMLDSTRGLMGVVAFIVYIAIAILILNAMLMAVFERIRELGVMKAIGYGPLTVFGLILAESAMQTLVATGLGLVLALPSMWYLQNVGIDTGVLGGMSMMGMSFIHRWTGLYSVRGVQEPVFILWFMVGAAVLYPALKAARIRPIQAMRYQ